MTTSRLAALFIVHCSLSIALAQNDPIMDEGFDEHGLKTILFDEGRESPGPLIHIDMTGYDSARRGIPDAVMKMAGYPLSMDAKAVETMMLGDISLSDRYQWGLNITREDTAGDGISDWVKMRPPGWEDDFRDSPLFFTITEEGVASATPPEEGDIVFIPALGDYDVTWQYMAIPLGDFRFPLGKHYQSGPVYISGYGTLEFGKAQKYPGSGDLPDPQLSGDAVAVAWAGWQPRRRDTNQKIVAGFRGGQRGQRYFFTRWEKMDYVGAYEGPLATFEGRLREDGRIEFHYLDGDFSFDEIFSGAQCWQGYYGLTVPKEKMVVGKKITFTPHYQLNPRNYNTNGDEIPDKWKLMFNINPHCTNAADMVFNDKGIKLRDCFEQRLNPWTAVSHLKPAP